MAFPAASTDSGGVIAAGRNARGKMSALRSASQAQACRPPLAGNASPQQAWRRRSLSGAPGGARKRNGSVEGNSQKSCLYGLPKEAYLHAPPHKLGAPLPGNASPQRLHPRSVEKRFVRDGFAYTVRPQKRGAPRGDTLLLGKRSQ